MAWRQKPAGHYRIAYRIGGTNPQRNHNGPGREDGSRGFFRSSRLSRHYRVFAFCRRRPRGLHEDSEDCTRRQPAIFATFVPSLKELLHGEIFERASMTECTARSSPVSIERPSRIGTQAGQLSKPFAKMIDSRMWTLVRSAPAA